MSGPERGSSPVGGRGPGPEGGPARVPHNDGDKNGLGRPGLQPCLT